jgi:hypothetical protein
MKKYLVSFLLVLSCFGKAELNPCIGNDCFCPAQLEVCEPACDDTGDCNVFCGETTCNATCGDVGDCNVQSGTPPVSVLCGANDLCSVECSSSSSCEVSCGGALDCNVSCSENNCIVKDCTQGDGCSVVCGLGGVIGVQQGVNVVCQ